MTIHSFRRVLHVDRVIRTINWQGRSYSLRWPLPIPAICYFATLEVLFIALSFLPGFHALSQLPWGMWWTIPAWLVGGAWMTRMDGRPPHRWVVAWVAYRRRPRRTRGGAPLPCEGERRRVRVRARAWHDEVTHR